MRLQSPRSRRALAGALIALITLLGGLALAPSASASEASNAADQQAMYDLTNQARASQGLAPLVPDVLAAEVAQGWARQLAWQQSLVHNPSLAAQITNQVTPAWTRIGENIGYAGDVWTLQNAFLNSPGHRANIMGDFNRVGIGAIRDGNGTLWVVLDFVKGPDVTTVSPSTFRPFASAPDLVTQQYADLLNRPADPSGLAFWSSVLDNGAGSPGQLVEGFMTSPEFGQLVAPLSRLYMAAFTRIPDYAGLTFWLSAERGGQSLGQIAQFFASSQEFVSRYGYLGLSDYVTQIYVNVLGRWPDAGGLAYWVGLLQQGVVDRGTMLVGFSESGEYQQSTWGTVNATLGYIGLLRRTPDSSGLAYWAGQLQAGVPISVFAASVLVSPEYALRFS